MSRTLRILIVEDDALLGVATAESLTLLGHTASIVPTVSAAFAALSVTHSFDVILLDLNLGEERGETIFEKLQLLRIKYPPVIILSAQPDAEVRLAADLVQAKQMLTKPASIARISWAIECAVAA
jgi:DNA-binding response OmpR family regulator